MHRLESKLTSVPLEALTDGIVVTAADGRIVLVNPAAEALLGAGADDLLGRPLEQLAPVVAGAGDARSGGALQSRVRRPDGSLLTLDIGFSAVQADGETLVVTALRAVPDRVGDDPADEAAADVLGDHVARAQRQLEELGAARGRSEALDATGRLAGRVAHDLNNVFGVIRNFAQFVLEAVPPGSQAADDVAQIVRAVERGMAISQQLIVLSRREPLQPRPLALNDAVDAGLASARTELAPGVEVRLDLCDGLPAVDMDPDAAVRLVRELLLHSSDMLPSGGTVTVATRAGAPGRVELAVTHAGPDAAPPPERPFEPAFAPEGEEEFPGLRLAVAHREAIRAGATISLAPAGEGGSAVTVALLAAAPTRSGPGACPPPPPPRDRPRRASRRAARCGS